MRELDLNSVTKFLYSFMNEMNLWEIEVHLSYSKCISTGSGWDQAVELAREKLECIYDKYLTKKQRKNGRLSGPDVATFPEYDPDLEKIEQIERLERKIIVATKKQDHNMKNYFILCRYILIEKNGIYLIDTKEIYSSHKEKWMNRVF
jgi:hypothetical protein